LQAITIFLLVTTSYEDESVLLLLTQELVILPHEYCSDKPEIPISTNFLFWEEYDLVSENKAGTGVRRTPIALLLQGDTSKTALCCIAGYSVSQHIL